MIEDISINFISRYVYREHIGYDHIYLQNYWKRCLLVNLYVLFFFFFGMHIFPFNCNAFDIFYNLKSN